MEEAQSDQNNEQQNEHKTEKPKKNRSGLKKAVIVLLVIIIAAGAAYGGYWYRGEQAKKEISEKDTQIASLQSEKDALQKQLEEANAQDDSSEESTSTSPSAADLENIEAAITSGNTAALESYMAKKVTVILAASECCGSRTQAQAVADLAYIDGATDPWDFDLPQSTLDGYASGDYKQYFPDDALVGKSANNYVISFTFDDSGDIDGIFVTNNAKLL